jgi:hypothetical protein
MSDTPDITEAAHQRDSEGNLQPVTETVEVSGSEYQVGVKPPTTGERNEWLRRLDQQDEELTDEFVGELLSQFAEHAASDFGAESWAGVRADITDSYAEVVLARLVGADDTDEFREALADAATEGNPD